MAQDRISRTCFMDTVDWYAFGSRTSECEVQFKENSPSLRKVIEVGSLCPSVMLILDLDLASAGVCMEPKGQKGVEL